MVSCFHLERRRSEQDWSANFDMFTCRSSVRWSRLTCVCCREVGPQGCEGVGDVVVLAGVAVSALQGVGQ